ncbi:putative methylesterase 11, chloroplastic isoform X3 [Magnolia sinica]|uniref:putative methylesterase 11, chloroplastic isoform X3 n=1 Tax=Magnolia sinica TaxID=86752 RepID=UPI0026594710|nr:putative methylesterase 11, chloroplastic isoform X3 [Magnolia sinica]
MGNLLSSCFPPKADKKKNRPSLSKRFSNAPPLGTSGIGSSNRWSKIRSSRKDKQEEALIQEQALAAAAYILQHQQQNGGSGGNLPFDRSASLRYPAPGPKKQSLPRSSSSRARSLTDPLLQPQQLVHQLESYFCPTEWLQQGPLLWDLKIDDLETNHFILVHGGGFGAWCWYKTIALLEEGGFKVDAIDLTGSGIHSFDTNSITSLSQYVKPLTDFLEKLGDGQKVILVGHDFGGACISYAMEEFPFKVAKAIFISAAMLTSGQSTLDMFSQQDVALASVSMRSIPFAPILEKLSLSNKYSSVRRFYIETPEDNAIPLPLQQSMINANPPERVFRLKGSDHAPFFSKPQALHKLLVEIAKVPLEPVR